MSSRAIVLWLAGLDLRLTLLAVPPVMLAIHRDLHLNATGVARVTNLPVLMLAGSSIFGSLLVSRIGARRALVAGMWVIAISSGLRGAGPSLAMLLAATFVMGLGIALIQPTFPTLAREWFPTRVAFATGIWSNALLAGEAIAASLTLPLVIPLVRGSWSASFAVWGAIVALTAIAVGFLLRGEAPVETPQSRTWVPNFRDRRVWEIGLLQAAASAAYFGANAFMPDYLNAKGEPGLVFAVLTALNVGQLPATFALGFLPARALARPEPSLAIAALLAVSIVAFVRFDGPGEVVAAAAIGFCGAYVLALSFALPPLLAPAGEVARTSAGVFTIGYSVAFLGSLLSGAAWDATHVPAVAFAQFAAAVALVGVCGPLLAERVRRSLAGGSLTTAKS
ncbi:MAG: MFS transporter [Candidatus Eremiobacteraeota bacterium]|nr:MFS transporter [Candidatus Eremiobacteraeota bacterium]